jgi:hypothetical protein
MSFLIGAALVGLGCLNDQRYRLKQREQYERDKKTLEYFEAKWAAEDEARWTADDEYRIPLSEILNRERTLAPIAERMDKTTNPFI